MCKNCYTSHKRKFSKVFLCLCQGSLIACEFLLQNGADVNQRDMRGRGPLHHATDLGHTGWETWKGCLVLMLEIAQLGERQTEGLKVIFLIWGGSSWVWVGSWSTVWGSWGSNQTSKSSEHLSAASYSLWHLFLNNCIFPCVLTEFTNSNLPDSGGVSLTSVSADVQSGVSLPEERSIADWGGRAGSRPPEHRSPSCQRRHRHPVSHLHSSQTSSCLKFQNFQTV